MEIISFNTSHVVVYRDVIAYLEDLESFQYISCCSLSSSPMLYPTKAAGFNTSHVVVYRADGYKVKADKAEFQYISCCSLSEQLKYFLNIVIGFNTSHVVVY